MHCSNESMRKIERIQERALRLLNCDYANSYKLLLHNSNSQTMQEKRINILAIEIFKTLNNLNPPYMKDLFVINNIRSHYPENLMAQIHHYVTYGEKSIRILGPKIWNALPKYLKQKRTLYSFKKLMKSLSLDSVCGRALFLIK